MDLLTNVGTRYICYILDDMRKCHELRHYALLPALIEEVQYRANRMESHLEAIHDIEHYEKQRIELKAEIRELKRKRDELAIKDE